VFLSRAERGTPITILLLWISEPLAFSSWRLVAAPILHEFAKMEIPFFASFATFAVKRVWPITNCRLFG
jgi:hypothetical protein